MKKLSLLCLLILFCGLPAYSQFWIDFSWDAPHCQDCAWMERSLRLSPKQAGDYHRMVHAYGKKIEKETRRNSRYWDRAARNIYNYRMDRDRKMEYLLTPQQFGLYIRYSRERPSLIHDYQGWYNNPHYPNYRPSHDCRHYEEDYWNYRWNNVQYDRHWRDERRDDGNRNNNDYRDDGRYDRNEHYDRDNRNDRNGRQPVKPNRNRDRKNTTKDKDYNSSRKAS